MTFRAPQKPTLFVINADERWKDRLQLTLSRLRGFLAGSNQIWVLSAADGDADTPFARRNELSAKRERIEAHLTRGGHVLAWIDFPPGHAKSLFFYSPVSAIQFGSASAADAPSGVGGVVDDESCAAGVDAAARAVLELMGSFDGIANFAENFDGAVEREKARAVKAERTARITSLTHEARSLVCKVCGLPTCGRVRKFLKDLPKDEAQDVQDRLRELIAAEAPAVASYM